MSDSNGHAPALDTDLAAVLRPVQEQLAEIERELAEVEERAKELRAKRQRRLRILAVVTPQTSQEDTTPKPKSGGGKGISPEKLDEAIGLLRSHIGDFPDGYYGKQLLDSAWWPIDQSRTSQIMRLLHKEGRLRLVRVGKKGEKIYKVVA